MTSNIEAIGAAEAQVLQLREKLKELRDEALADDGIVDADEKKEIERVEVKINSLQGVISTTRMAWESNKAAFEKRRSKIAKSLDEVKNCENDDVAKDQKAIFAISAQADEAAQVQDYAKALGFTEELERLVNLFQKTAENERLEGLTDEELAKERLATDAIEEVFSEDYMRALMTVELKGEGTPELKDLMSELEKGISSSRRAEFMKELEIVVGSPPSASELDADYARFLVLCRQRDEIGKESGPIASVDEEKHPEFEASRSQLMFGKVLGDALGIHEVFASTLSPTGGLVGPGNDLIPGCVASPHLDPDNPVALHGTLHDAGGYLASFHDDGPGYNYRDGIEDQALTFAIELLPFGLDKTLLPVTGQVSGVRYWAVEAGDEYVATRYNEGVAALEAALADARNNAAANINELVTAVGKAKSDMSNAADAFKDDMQARRDEAEQDLRDLAKDAENEALEVVDAFEDAVDKAATDAVEAYEEASAGARAIGDDAMEKLDAVANFIWN